ncbi:hypothetical protein IWX48DRAFT_236781 [Phyllosticta citricarpa]
MSEDKASGSGKGQGAAPSFADVATGIVDECLRNIIHEIILSTHRDEKLQRMQSAATVAEQAAIQEHQDNAEKTKGASSSAAQPPSVKIDTPAAVYDNGRVTLRGNPLKTTPEIICPCCKLPRLMYPIAGAGAQMPDLSKNYCNRHPFVSRPGHDIYNNPFPTDMAKTKKERELIKRQEKDNTPGSQDTEGGTGAEGATNSQLSKLAAGGKPASYIPWHTCPNCKRSLLITRFAQHAEKCLGISGRQSSRNAMAKLNNHGTGSANTPLGSRVGTPVPGGTSSQGAAGGKISPVKKGANNANHTTNNDDNDAENDDAAPATVDTTPKKVKKKSSYVKKADREKDDGKEKSSKASSSSNKDKDKEKDKDRQSTPAAALGGSSTTATSGTVAAATSTSSSSSLLNANNKRERERDKAAAQQQRSKQREQLPLKKENSKESGSDESRGGGGRVESSDDDDEEDDDDDDDDDDGAPLKKKMRLAGAGAGRGGKSVTAGGAGDG